MELNFSETMKDLRKEQGNTQEGLPRISEYRSGQLQNGKETFPINKDTGINPQTYIAYEK